MKTTYYYGKKATKSFKEAVEAAKAQGLGYILKFSTSKQKNNVVDIKKTILAWDAYVISYQMGKMLFKDNTSLAEELEKKHRYRISKAENEVYLWAPSDGTLMEMYDINFQRVTV